MDKSFFRSRAAPKLENPLFVEGLPGFGNVGKIAAQMLINATEAKRFAELYSPFFPDYVLTNKRGLCRPPRYEFYASSTGDRHFIILTGDAQPSLEDLKAHYRLCDEILDFAEKHGSRFIVTIGGVPTPSQEGEIYIAATSNELALKYAEKGGIIYGKGRIMGATGLLLGLAKNRGWEGLCLLGATTGLKADREAALSVFRFLSKALELHIDEKPKTKEP
jgi:uncharacterized protein (TIGR00162 family)